HAFTGIHALVQPVAQRVFCPAYGDRGDAVGTAYTDGACGGLAPIIRIVQSRFVHLARIIAGASVHSDGAAVIRAMDLEADRTGPDVAIGISQAVAEGDIDTLACLKLLRGRLGVIQVEGP